MTIETLTLSLKLYGMECSIGALQELRREIDGDKMPHELDAVTKERADLVTRFIDKYSQREIEKLSKPPSNA